MEDVLFRNEHLKNILLEFLMNEDEKRVGCLKWINSSRVIKP